jgi:hypothetical protein
MKRQGTAAPTEFGGMRVFQRPTGYYVRLAGTREEFGPFRTVSEAVSIDADEDRALDDADDSGTLDLGYECAFPAQGEIDIDYDD